MTRIRMISNIVGIALIGVLVSLGLRPIRNVLPVPLWLKHFLNSLLAPSDIYSPIVEDSFRFTERGFSKSYTLRTRYADFHEVGLVDPTESIPVSYKFAGILEFTLSCQGRTVRTETVTSMGTAWSATNDPDRYKRIALFEFPIPLERHCPAPVLTVTVIEPDDGLRALKTPPQLYVAVSATP